MREEAALENELPRIQWLNTSIMTLFHLGAVAALFMFTWRAFAVCVLLYWVAGSLGIGMGYHRLLTHRGYKTPKILEYFFSLCGSLALQGGPIDWVVTHRIHHAFSDRDGDPHSPRDGGWWAHMGWILSGKAQNHDSALMRKFAPDLMRDRFQVWLNRYHLLPLILVGLVLLALGGWPFVMWGVFMRVTLGLQATWLVNSATHIWGKRRFETRDDSRNNWWVALVTFGEGWHNNHHAHPASARHGLAWYELDINWWGIRALQSLGLAKSILLARVHDSPPQTAIAEEPVRENVLTSQ